MALSAGPLGLVELNPGTRYLRFVSLRFETSRGAGMLSGTDCLDVMVVNCTFSGGAGNAIMLQSSDFEAGTGPGPASSGHVISGASIHDMGRGGIIATGGVRTSLTPSNISIANCNITRVAEWLFTYQFGIRIHGVGVHVTNSEMSEARHEGLSMPGNDHTVEYSRFHHLVTEAHDAGAIHQGRDWTWRGRTIRYNLFDHIGRFAFYPGLDGSLPCNSPPTSCIRAGIYADDHEGGLTIRGNIFAGTEVVGYFAHNGRDTGPPEGGVDNNLFLGAGLGVRLAGVHACRRDNATLWAGLEAMPF